MHKSITLNFMALLLGNVFLMGASGQQNSAPLPDTAPTIFQASTQLVIVDVVVQSKDGHPIHGLKQEMFHLAEGGVPQTIRHFEEHSSLRTAPSGPAIPKLPAGTFTDYSPVPRTTP